MERNRLTVSEKDPNHELGQNTANAATTLAMGQEEVRNMIAFSSLSKDITNFCDWLFELTAADGNDPSDSVKEWIECLRDYHQVINVFGSLENFKSFLDGMHRERDALVEEAAFLTAGMDPQQTLNRYHEYSRRKLLDVQQVKWVREQIESHYAETQRFNSPFFRVKGVPTFPSKEGAIRSALNQLSNEQVAFMMRQEHTPFIFQIKLVTPSNKMDAQKILLDEQRDRLNSPEKIQAEMCRLVGAKCDLFGRFSIDEGQWRWEFSQRNRPSENRNQDGRDLNTAHRIEIVQRIRPEGMHGIDRFSWIAHLTELTSTSPFFNTLTLLDGEGEFREGNGEHPFLLAVGFGSTLYTDVRRCYMNVTDCSTRLYSCVEGQIEDTEVEL